MIQLDKKTLVKYGLTVLLCGAVTYMYVSSKDLPSLSTAQKFRVLADGFTIPGLLLCCIGLLLVISNTGVLDGVAYGITVGIRMLLMLWKNQDYLRYSDYVEYRKQNRLHGFEFIIHVGAFFMVIALIFVALFYRYE